jgi:DNA-binding GntR family transcriptional regulator
VHEYSPADYRDMIEARSLVTDGLFHQYLDERSDISRAARAALDPRADDPHRAATLAGVRRRGEEAERAAAAGDLNILIGYDLRFWRELSNLFGNPYLADFLHRLRVQSWVCAVQYLRTVDLRGRLWAEHTALVDALARRDAEAAHEIVTAYNAHSLALIERLAAG